MKNEKCPFLVLFSKLKNEHFNIQMQIYYSFDSINYSFYMAQYGPVLPYLDTEYP